MKNQEKFWPPKCNNILFKSILQYLSVIILKTTEVDTQTDHRQNDWKIGKYLDGWMDGWMYGWMDGFDCFDSLEHSSHDTHECLIYYVSQIPFVKLHHDVYYTQHCKQCRSYFWIKLGRRLKPNGRNYVISCTLANVNILVYRSVFLCSPLLHPPPPLPPFLLTPLPLSLLPTTSHLCMTRVSGPELFGLWKIEVRNEFSQSTK